MLPQKPRRRPRRRMKTTTHNSHKKAFLKIQLFLGRKYVFVLFLWALAKVQRNTVQKHHIQFCPHTTRKTHPVANCLRSKQNFKFSIIQEGLSTKVCLQRAFLSNYDLSKTCFGCTLPTVNGQWQLMMSSYHEKSKMKFYFAGKPEAMCPILEAVAPSGEPMSKDVNPVPVSHS